MVEIELVTSSPGGNEALGLYDQHVSRLFARISQKLHVQASRNLMHMLPMAVARFPLMTVQLRFVLPVLWMTSCFHIMARCVAWHYRHGRHSAI